MKMIEVIEMLDGTRRSRVVYEVKQELLGDFDERERMKCSPFTKRMFFDVEDVIAYLFDLDLFGWQIRSWNFTSMNTHWTYMTLNLYKVEGAK